MPVPSTSISAGLVLVLLSGSAALGSGAGDIPQAVSSSGGHTASTAAERHLRTEQLPAASRERNRSAAAEAHTKDRTRFLQSSLDARNQTFVSMASEQRDFYVFHNVVLTNNSLLYLQPDESAALPEDLPKTLRLSRYEVQMDVPVVVVNSSNWQSYPVNCSKKQVISKPALLFAGTPWDTNYYEFFATTLMPLFQTAVMSGLYTTERIRELAQQYTPHQQRARMLAELHNPKTMAPFTLISGRPTFYGTQWNYLIHALTTDQLSLQHIDRACYATLAVSEDGTLRFLWEHTLEMRDMGFREERAAWLKRFQEFLFAAERVHLTVNERYWPASIGDSGSQHKRPRVVFVSRARDRRGILNEAEIVQYLVKTWDANVTVTKFDSGLARAIALMQETDVLIGVHGAGLTNSLFMKDGGVLLQMLPYGWALKPGQIMRSGFSADISELMQGRYLQWVNTDAQHAYFHKPDWDMALADWSNHPGWGTKPGAYMEHPNSSLPLPVDAVPPTFWVYQSTYVDLKSFGPVLDQAMQFVKAERLQATH